ncbi:protein HID1-like isoform X3 [Branchiostoma floridae]|uniref:Protein HID1-like isoform X3 n=1 Tax=Branchiostoma floridae TaxID=7739 RepID=A0A9J7MA46_BRAFL|nr:protein HID1-like isoform X3 [Branchiostoma floridae]
MGNSDTKLNFRKAVIQLTTKTQPVEAQDEAFWDQFWTDSVTSVQDVFALVPAAEIRALREESPSNLATLCYKAVEKLVMAAESSCATAKEQQTVLNCVRLLTRILPYIFEDADWRGFFWSTLPGQAGENDSLNDEDGGSMPLAQSLLNALSDLLFCPDFTVAPNKKAGPETHEDLQSIDSCEYIWESGVGFAHSPAQYPHHDQNRSEILKLLLTCFSETMYQPPAQTKNGDPLPNQWLTYFASSENRHALPLFTSLLNIVCAYDPIGYGMPYNHLLFSDYREPTVEVALQLLIVVLDHDNGQSAISVDGTTTGTAMDQGAEITREILAPQEGSQGEPQNLFVNYLSRIHREEDFHFILKGITNLLNNPLIQTYLPNSCKKINFHQEILVLFWKLCEFNKKFLFYVLKSSDVLDVIAPILYHLNDSRQDQSRVGLMHIGVFILLLLSGERNFGVRLNKPYTVRVPMDIPVFTGTHADFLIIVFHKIITTGHQRLQPLFDCLLTIIVNVSPYLKSLSMVASTKLLHLLEAFSTPWFLFSNPSNHHLVFFLLEVFNNIIQYQFDGNANLVYTIIRKRNVFHQLANLPTDRASIEKAVSRKRKGSEASQRPVPHSPAVTDPPSMEGSFPAQEAQPGTLKATLAEMPGIERLTEKMEASSLAEQAAEDADTPGAAGPSPSDTESSVEDNKPAASTPVPQSPTSSTASVQPDLRGAVKRTASMSSREGGEWRPTSEWVQSWKQKLPLQTIMRLLQVLVPQVEKICIDKGLTDESEILKFLQHGTLVGLLPVPHPILIRKYQANSGTTMWFRTYMWGIIYLRNVDPPIWYDTDVKLFEIQRV